MILVEILQNGFPVAGAAYEPGMLVEISVAEAYQTQDISFELVHTDNHCLKGKWQEALDQYFNEEIFDCRETVFPGEMKRIGCAKDHKSLFQHAAHALLKNLEPHGYTINIKFQY